MPEAEWWPLTAAQHGIWTGQQLAPESPAYNTAEYVEIEGDIDLDLLAAAIRRAVAETEALNVRFEGDGAAPRQVAWTPGWEPYVADLRAAPDPLGAAEDWMARDVARPVDPRCDVLFGHALFRLADRRYLWYHRVHHILLDGYGLALVARRVADVYTALAEGRRPSDRPFGSLRDVIAEDRAYTDSDRCAHDRDFWVSYHRDRPAPATLAGRTAPLAGHVVRQAAEADRRTAESLRKVASRARANWSEALIAAVAAYLHRMTGETTVSVAVPVMLRTGGAALRVPCMVLNVVQMWARITPGATLTALTAQIAGHMRAGRRHHRYRYEQLRRDLRMVRGERKLFGPSVNIMPFDYGLRFAGHPGVVRNVSAGLVEDLAVNVYDRADGDRPRIVLDGNPNLYPPDELAAHARRFSAFLRNCLDAPLAPVDEVDLPLDEERRLLLGAWQGPTRPWPRSTVPDLLHDRVARTPDLTALVCRDTAGAAVTLTYAELGRRSGALARLLADRGAKPGTVVALLLPRTADAVIALFAVLKTGAAYLPIDPDHPARRVASTLDDARPILTVTTSALAETLPPAAATLLVDDVTPPDGSFGEPPGPRPADTLYLIYTSGSTGRPKGAWVTHEGMVNLFHHHRTEMIEPEVAARGGARFRAALTASLSFDTSWEGLLWLLAGHELHVVDDDVRREPEALLRYVADHGIDFLDVTPTYAEELLTAGLLEPDRRRPAVIALGGEAAGPALWSALRPAASGISVYNLYGPTECTVDATWARLRDSETPVIGGPVANGRCLVLDANMRLLPPGAAGELYLGGAPLGGGYHGRPGLTAEKFVPDPFGPPGSRLYRTGDLARRRLDGRLDCLGRADDQVKVRGFRIEPGEIEAVLAGHPGITQAAVVVRAGRSGGERLVAYVVATPGGRPPGPATLRGYAAERLPDYMVPSLFVPIERMPVNANGKLDRAALPAPPDGLPPSRPPRDERERVLCGLFSEVLDVPEVGVDDDFFALGGHSLSAARLLGRVRSVLGVRLGIRDVFESATVAGLVERMAAGGPSESLPWAGFDLDAEAVPGKEITTSGTAGTAGTADAGGEGDVLLTGATGFLGIFLLRELLDRTGARVHCLVRARDEREAGDRLRATLDRYRLPTGGLGDRVVAVPGDLALPRLGLTPERFALLAGRIGAIFHNGARVNHLETYARLRAANVTGTAEILRLATTGRVKAVHYVSTCDTAYAIDGNPAVLTEDRRVSSRSLTRNGYVASKWVAEGLVLEAARRGVPVWVYRPSRVGGHSVSGAGSRDDAFWHLIRAMLTLGAAPDGDGPPGHVDLVPVDQVSAAIVRLAHGTAPGATYHLTSPRPLPVTVVLDTLRELGHRLTSMPVATWRALLAERAERAAADADLALAVAATHDRRDGTPVVFGRDNVTAVLPGSAFPPIDRATVVAWVGYLTETGFLPPPPEGTP